MSKQKVLNLVSEIDISGPELSLQKADSGLELFLAPYKIESENLSLFKAILLTLCSAHSVKTLLVKILKENKKNADLSASLLVDIDTRFELLLAHSVWLLTNFDKGSEFDLNLRSGARLCEEFFPDLVLKLSKIQSTFLRELGLTEESLNTSGITLMLSNLGLANTHFIKLLAKYPNRYDSLAIGLLGM